MWDLRHFPQVDKDKQKAYNTRKKKKIVLLERKKKSSFSESESKLHLVDHD